MDFFPKHLAIAILPGSVVYLDMLQSRGGKGINMSWFVEEDVKYQT